VNVLEARDTVSKVMNLQPEFYMRTAIGNTHGLWDGVETLRAFIATAPDEPMNTSTIRTWSEVKADAHKSMEGAANKAAVLKRRKQELQNVLQTTQDNIKYYESAIGRKSLYAGGALTLVAGCALLIPGLNAVVGAGAGVAAVTSAITSALGAAGAGAAVMTAAGGAAASTKAGINLVAFMGLYEAEKKAKAALKEFSIQKPDEAAKAEEVRLKRMLSQIKKLEEMIDRQMASRSEL